jgi:hypothetical protein
VIDIASGATQLVLGVLAGIALLTLTTHPTPPASLTPLTASDPEEGSP